MSFDERKIFALILILFLLAILFLIRDFFINDFKNYVDGNKFTTRGSILVGGLIIFIFLA